MVWTLSIVGYFLAAALIVVVGARARLAVLFATLSPFVFQLAIAAREAAVLDSTPGRKEIDWLPSLGVTPRFPQRRSGAGAHRRRRRDRAPDRVLQQSLHDRSDRRVQFLALMLLFSGGMAGLVTSDEIFGLFIFWEVTTMASFLLIGFDDERAAARSAAVQALLVTTAGGLAMLAGLIILSAEAGTTSISELVAAPPSGRAR